MGGVQGAVFMGGALRVGRPKAYVPPEVLVLPPAAPCCPLLTVETGCWNGHGCDSSSNLRDSGMYYSAHCHCSAHYQLQQELLRLSVSTFSI